MTRGLLAGAALLVALPAARVAAAPPPAPRTLTVAPGADPVAWAGFRELRFSGRASTAYRLEAEDGRTVLAAGARDAASLLYVRVDGGASGHRRLRWRWRVERAPTGADLRCRGRDDAAARVYVGFVYSPRLVPPGQRIAYWLARLAHGEYPPYAGVAYVWADRPGAGTTLVHPDYPRLLEMVIRSGPAPDGGWVEEERDVVADYRAAFGADPPAISHLAVMSDADDTGSVAAARFAELVLLPGADGH